MNIKNLIKTFGPGIMFAGTCIGGSHLVQSTRAGANYGFELLVIILLANFFKYPFFEFASRYTSATGDSILEGFKKEGKWTLYVYGAITLISMFIITAAILFVAGGLLGTMFHANPDHIFYWTTGLGVVVWILLTLGKFNLLDSTLKIIGGVLVLSVSAATIMVIFKGRPTPIETFVEPELYTIPTFGFVIALMGWMPMGVDMSAWTSLWTQERIKQTNYHPTLKETLLDFNVGYFITVVLAICFLTLGTYVFYGSGETLSNNSVTYSNQLVSMFTSSIGEWSYTIIAAAAFSTMFGTSLTLVDGYTRTMDRIIQLIKKEESTKTNYFGWSTVTILGGILIILFGTVLKDQENNSILDFKTLIDIATGLSFLIAPIAAYFNYRIIFNKKIPKDYLPPKWLKTLAIGGIIFLSLFTIGYLTTILFKYLNV